MTCCEKIKTTMTDVELLVEVGTALYGDRWQTDTAAALGLSDARRIRAWLSGSRRMPPGIWVDLIALMEKREAEIAAAREKISANKSTNSEA